MRAAALLLVLAAAASADPPPRLTEVPPALGQVAWEAAPADLLAQADRGRVVVWLGAITAAKIEPGDGMTHLRLLCRHLPLVDPGPQTLADHVFVARRSPPGYFVATLDVREGEAEVQKVVASMLAHRHFALVAGRSTGVQRWGGHVAVVLETARLEVDDQLRVAFR